MRLALMVMALLLCGCDAGERQPLEGVTPAEAEALNDAAAMLDEANQPKPGDSPKAAEGE